ncbi:MAG: hypothetical protein HQK54_15275, partial [Oligoflexales bacterium]|nr:hypothetical protein [Oligoflexales bacterium]
MHHNSTYFHLGQKLGLILSAVIFMNFTGCGVFVGNPNEDDDDSGNPKNQTTLSGSVVMGPVKGAVVKVYSLYGNGGRNELLNSVKTDANGAYSMQISYSGPIELVASLGQYEDEATGELVERRENDELITVLENQTKCHFAINPLTTIAAYKIRSEISKGLKEAITSSNQSVAGMFGISGIDFVSTKPSDLTKSDANMDASSPEGKVGLIMAGFSQM